MDDQYGIDHQLGMDQYIPAESCMEIYKKNYGSHNQLRVLLDQV